MGIRKLLPKSEFSKNVLTLMTGTTLAQAIPVAISPILTRLYTPKDFGVYALFVSIVSILGSIANGRYELALMLPKKDEDAINIFALGFVINVFFSLFLLITIFIFHDYIVRLLKNKEISMWLYFIPLIVFLMGCFNLLNYFNNRLKQYKDLAKANAYKSIAMAIVQVSLGVLKPGAFGLISGQIVSQFVANMKLFFNIKKLNLLKKIKKVKIIAIGKRYKDFPKYSMWSVLLNTFTFQITNILISAYYNITTLGYYSLVQRILGIPSSLIGNSISQVYFQESSKEKINTGIAIHSFKYTLRKLIIFSFPFFTILFFYVEDIFTYVFGKNWEICGLYAKILIPLFMVKFLSSTLSITNAVFEKNKIGLYINIILFFSILIIWGMAKFVDLSFIQFLILYSMILGIEYLLFLIYYYYLANGKFRNV